MDQRIRALGEVIAHKIREEEKGKSKLRLNTIST